MMMIDNIDNITINIIKIIINRTTAALDWIYTNAMPFETCSRGV